MRHDRFSLVKKLAIHRISDSIRVLLLMSLSLGALEESAVALDLSLGGGTVENGDDRGHGVAIAQLGFSNGWMGRTYYWGRTQGPVTETNHMLTAAKRFDLFGGKTLRGAAGLTVLSETTELKFKDYPEDNASATSTNAGVYLGLSYDLLAIKSVTINASWDAHLFPAGGAMLALVTGRKQVLGLSAGVAF
jgi:hypothetical protein